MVAPRIVTHNSLENPPNQVTLRSVPNDHTTAIVPLQCWTYESPLLRRDRTPIDVGLLAEALIYYGRILLVPVTEVPVAKVLDKPTTNQGPYRPFDAEWRRSF